MQCKIAKQMVATLDTLCEAEDKLATSYDLSDIPDYYLRLMEQATSQVEAAVDSVLHLKNVAYREGY